MPIERLKCFISYSSKDKKLAGRLKKCLGWYGLDVFLAHDDIEPSAAWVQTLLAELKAARVFLPLLTDNFTGSAWTDQETGIAVAGEKLIVPLRVDIVPYGFMGSVQALTLDPDNLDTGCAKIARTIGKNPECREKFLDGLIEMFAESFSFDQAGQYATWLMHFDGYTAQQARSVLLSTLANDQIHRSFKAQEKIGEFIKAHGGDVDVQLVKKAKQALR